MSNSNLARSQTLALTGMSGTVVEVEAAVTRQLPGMAIIGLPDVALAEAKLRVKIASAQSGFPLTDKFITINLSPAALPKHGSSFDLAVALAALAASRYLPAEAIRETIFIGELGLDGSLRRPRGLLNFVYEASRLGFQRVMVPSVAASEALLVPGMEVVSAETLLDAIRWLRGEPSGCRVLTHEEHIDPSTLPMPEFDTDISEVLGQEEAIDALLVAAAGRHNISMIGPPGAGKTMLASRLPTILPQLRAQEALENSCIASLEGESVEKLIMRPPFEAPHHTATTVAIVGGGRGEKVSIGAVTRANNGVLFLDEAPEFSRATLDALRQPLEKGTVEIHRANLRVQLPARFQLVLAANPCPCGNAGAVETEARCQCAPIQRRNYISRISGPLKDRIDIRLAVQRAKCSFSPTDIAPRTSEMLRAQVSKARETAIDRLKNTPWNANAEIPGKILRSSKMQLPHERTALIDTALDQGRITLRGYDRILRIAWSVADLAGHMSPSREDIATALHLREECTE